MVSQLQPDITPSSYFDSSIELLAYSKSSDFEAILEGAHPQRTQNRPTIYIQRISFEFIKALTSDDIALIYSDLSKDERYKISFLVHIANISENELLNEILFDKAKEMTTSQVISFYSQKATEQYGYKNSNNKHLFVFQPLNKQDNQAISLLEDDSHKLTYSQAFEFILTMAQNAKEAIEVVTQNSLKQMYKKICNEYEELVDLYMQKLQRKVV